MAVLETRPPPLHRLVCNILSLCLIIRRQKSFSYLELILKRTDVSATTENDSKQRDVALCYEMNYVLESFHGRNRYIFCRQQVSSVNKDKVPRVDCSTIFYSQRKDMLLKFAFNVRFPQANFSFYIFPVLFSSISEKFLI